MDFRQYFFESLDKKLIVYHGTNNKFKSFNFENALQKIIWFTSDIDSIKNNQTGAQGNKYIY